MSSSEIHTPFVAGLLHQKAVIVTGAGQPIANAIAHRYGQAGAQLALLALPEQEAAARELAGRLGTERVMACELSNPQAVSAAVRQLTTELGGVDLLVNAHLCRAPGKLSEQAPAQWKELFERQLSGTAYLCKEVIRPMMRKRSGRILTLLDAAPGGASKVAAEGVAALTRSLANEVSRQGIFVNTLAVHLLPEEAALLPAAQRERLDSELGPLGRLGSPEEIAEAALFLASSASNLMTGQRLSATGGGQ